MKNIKNLLILSVTALAICSGITFTGCSSDSSDSGGGDTSPTLITQWRLNSTDLAQTLGDIYCYDDGSFKIATISNGMFAEIYSGTYDGDTLNDGEITFTVTKYLNQEVTASAGFTATITAEEKLSITDDYGNLSMLPPYEGSIGSSYYYTREYANKIVPGTRWEGKIAEEPFTTKPGDIFMECQWWVSFNDDENKTFSASIQIYKITYSSNGAEHRYESVDISGTYSYSYSRGDLQLKLVLNEIPLEYEGSYSSIQKTSENAKVNSDSGEDLLIPESLNLVNE